MSISLRGQISCDTDTIHISEVIINRKTGINPDPGLKIISVDSSLLSFYSNRPVSDLISENSTIYIKSYGPGGISVPSFRGTSAGHTIISWNGLNINNPMPGQFDMSLVPAGFIDNIDIYFGGGSMEISGGGLGGIIDLETKPKWNKSNSLIVSSSAGSYGRYSGLMKYTWRSKSFMSSTKAFLGKSENNFRFLNTASIPIAVWERRKNSQVLRKGFMQEFYYKSKNSGILSARFWYQSADRNLPVPVTVEPVFPSEKQFDESFRTMLDYESGPHNPNLKISGAYFRDKLLYKNQSADTDSRNISNDLILKAESHRKINQVTSIKKKITDELSIINSNNYSKNRLRNAATATFITESRPYERLSGRILLSETLQDNRIMIPDFSVASEFRIVRGKEYFLKLNASRNSKYPSLNDMYWNPGGNPDLRNENGWLFEAGIDLSGKITQHLKIKNDITFIKTFINDLIQWHPGTNGAIWVADNLKKAEITGVEAGIDLIYDTPGLTILLKSGYAFTRAVSGYQDENNILKSNDQIIYVPESKFNSSLKLIRRRIYAEIGSCVISRRYLTADNSQYLPSYSVTDLSAGVKFSSGKTSWNINFAVENLFGMQYQNVAWYPMPGRSYNLSLILNLSV